MLYFVISSLLITTHGLESGSTELDESNGARCFTENGLQHLEDIPEFSSCRAFKNKNTFEDVSEDEAALCGIQITTNFTIEEIALNFNNMGLLKVSDAFSNFFLCYSSAAKLNFELNFEENRIDCTSTHYDGLRNSDRIDFYCTQKTQDLISFCTRLKGGDCNYYSHCYLNNDTGVCKDKEVDDAPYATSTVRIVSQTTFTYESKQFFEENDAQSLINDVVNDAKSLLSKDQTYVQVSAEVRFNKTSVDNDTFTLVLEVYYVVNISATAGGIDSEDARDEVNKLGSSYIEFILSKDTYTVNSVSFDTKSISMDKDKWNMEVTKKRNKMQLRLVASMVVIALILLIVIIFEGTVLFNAVTGPSGYSVSDAVVHIAMREMEKRIGMEVEESEDSDDSGGYSYSESDDSDESSESESSSYAHSNSSYSSYSS